MIGEILDLGFKRVELGYNLRIDLVQGVRSMVANGSVKVDSVHNFCPVPIGAPAGHPELFQLSDTDSTRSNAAVRYTTESIRFAAEIGAKCVVAHAGNVTMKNLTRALIELAEEGHQYGNKYDKIKMDLMLTRDKKVAGHLDALRHSLGRLLPVLEQSKIQLALEGLPSWESIPSEAEAEVLLKEFNSPFIRCWHDTGHAQTRHNLGFVNQYRWMERLRPWLAGMHVHDVQPPATDHLVPGKGTMDFTLLRETAISGIPLVMEPLQGTPAASILQGVEVLKNSWLSNPAATQKAE